jgi:hypothetical protein
MVSALTELEPGSDIDANHLDLLGRWVEGATGSTLRAEFGVTSDSADEFARFIEQYFGYRLPWGLSGLLRIARHVLAINEVSVSAQYLPAMVKFGVPSPSAAWAMSIVVPSREVAVNMAADFTRRGGGDYTAFRNWLSGLDLDDLRDTYGLRSPLLEDVYGAVIRRTVNPYLRGFQGLEAQLPLETRIRGATYGERTAAARQVRPGDVLAIQRDYQNVADRNAILVKHEGRELGYVPRAVAQLVAPYLDTGVALFVRALSGGTGPVDIELSAL